MQALSHTLLVFNSIKNVLCVSWVENSENLKQGLNKECNAFKNSLQHVGRGVTKELTAKSIL